MSRACKARRTTNPDWSFDNLGYIPDLGGYDANWEEDHSVACACSSRFDDFTADHANFMKQADHLARYLLLDFASDDPMEVKAERVNPLGMYVGVYHLMFVPPKERVQSLVEYGGLLIELSSFLLFPASLFVLWHPSTGGVTDVSPDSLLVNYQEGAGNALDIMGGVLIFIILAQLFCGIGVKMMTSGQDWAGQMKIAGLISIACNGTLFMTFYGMFLISFYAIVQFPWDAALAFVGIGNLAFFALTNVLMRYWYCDCRCLEAMQWTPFFKLFYWPAFAGKYQGSLFLSLGGDLEEVCRERARRLIASVPPSSDTGVVLQYIQKMRVNGKFPSQDGYLPLAEP